ncbi:MAG: hypothetical protein M5U30_19120 [Burkholderiaceae bacterium]|nr:hypothetical protein [Burkholderiaceae bacterium]
MLRLSVRQRRDGEEMGEKFIRQPLRYSEDIDLVQAHPESIGHGRHDSRSAVVAREMQPGAGRTCRDHYLALERMPITRAMAEQRMLDKLPRSLTEGVAPMLPANMLWSDEDSIRAFEHILTERNA